MSNTILIKRSSTPNAVPASGNLALGELAINYADGNLFYKDATNAVKVIASNQFVSVTGNITGANINASNLSLSGNVLSVINSTSNINTTANISGGNVTTTGVVSASGNIIAAGLALPSLTGNIVAFGGAFYGNLDVYGNLNATIGLVYANSGIFYGNTVTGNGAAYAGVPGFTPLGSNVVMQFAGNVNSYSQLNFQNINSGTEASTDLILTANNGDDETFFVDLGIGSNNYSAVDYPAYGPNDTYLLNEGGNLLLNPITPGTLIKFIIGGADTPDIAATMSNTVFSMTGNVSASGNVNAGNLNAAGLSLSGNVLSAINSTSNVTTTANISGAYILGNISQATGFSGSKIFNGTSEANIGVSNGNANISINGTSNVAVFADTGLYVTGLTSVTGNIIAGNISTSGDITGANVISATTLSASSNVVGGNLNAAGLSLSGNVLSVINSTSNINTTANISGGNVLFGSGVVSGTGNVIASTISATGNIFSSNGISATGNIIAANVNTSLIQPTSGPIEILTTGGANIDLYASGNIRLNNNYINNLLDPIQGKDAATKEYVDNAVSTGIHIHEPVYVVTQGALNATYAQGGTTQTVNTITGNKTLTFLTSPALAVNDIIVFDTTTNGITAGDVYFVFSTNGTNQITITDQFGGSEITTLTNAGAGLGLTSRANSGVGATLTNAGSLAALSVDSQALTTSQRVLVNQQATAAQNGVYAVTTVGDGSTAWVLTRTLDQDAYSPSDPNGMGAGDYFFVQAGEVSAGQSYVLTSPEGPFIIGTDAVVYTQFSGGQVYSAGNGLTELNNTFSVNVDNDTTAIVNGNVVVKASANLTTPNIGDATGTSLSLSGNIVSGNVNTTLVTATTLSATGNITGANVVTATTLSATANVQAGNLRTSGLISATGNATAGNISTAGTANIATLIVNTFANVTATTISTDTITGAMVIGGGLGVAGNIYAGALYDNGTAVLTINSTVDGGTY